MFRPPKLNSLIWPNVRLTQNVGKSVTVIMVWFLFLVLLIKRNEKIRTWLKSNQPVIKFIGFPSTYRAGLSLAGDQQRHTECHFDGWSWTFEVVHSVPNSHTTKLPDLPPRPSSTYWASGWRYMKAVHGDSRNCWMLRMKTLPVCKCLYQSKCGSNPWPPLTSNFRLKHTVNSRSAGMKTWGFNFQWLHLGVRSATFPHRLSWGAEDRSRRWRVNH